jgi:hypothetical protein
MTSEERAEKDVVLRKHREAVTRGIREAVKRRDFEGALVTAGRNAGPALLAKWVEREIIGREEVRALLPVVWTMAEWPERHFGAATWIGLFRWVGFVSDDPSIVAPSADMRIYRGSTYDHRFGMAWTTSVERAERFANRSRDFFGLANVEVFVGDAPPSAVLARIVGGRQEAEVVVDPAMLASVAAVPSATLEGLRALQAQDAEQ